MEPSSETFTKRERKKPKKILAKEAARAKAAAK